MHTTTNQILNPNIDHYINPWIPHNRFGQLPQPLQRFLGHRSQPHVDPPRIVQWLLTFLASVAGICFVGGVFNYAPGIRQYHPPALIASLGASAVLDYNVIRSPLAQPRNAVVGNTLSALAGVTVSKGFQRLSNFQEIRWVSGAFGCALSSLVMSVTGTIHPPGGATAVIASVEASVVDMGWIYVVLVLLASVMMQVVALIFNNTLRQYPVYWWTPEVVGRELRRKLVCNTSDEEQGKTGAEHREEIPAPASEADSEATLRREVCGMSGSDGQESILILAHYVKVPDRIQLSEDDVKLLGTLQERLLCGGNPIYTAAH